MIDGIQPVGVGYILPIYLDAPPGGTVHAAQDVERRGLARTRGTQDDGELPLAHLKGGAVQGVDGRLAYAIGTHHLREPDSDGPVLKVAPRKAAPWFRRNIPNLFLDLQGLLPRDRRCKMPSHGSHIAHRAPVRSPQPRLNSARSS